MSREDVTFLIGLALGIFSAVAVVYEFSIWWIWIGIATAFIVKEKTGEY